MSISSRGLEFLQLIGDHSVGGPHVTPCAESYSNLREVRRPLRFTEDWNFNEAVHINAAFDSLRSAYAKLGKESMVPDLELVDRVVVLDFDNYNKDGSPKQEDPTTFEAVLAQLNSKGMTLPFCKVESGTPGNFHLIWVLATPAAREECRELLRPIYAYWGSDLGYTNSTQRNPIYAEKWLGTTSWWDAWTDEAPLLSHPVELLPTYTYSDKAFKAVEGVKVISANRFRHSKYGLYVPRMSEAQLLEAMRVAQDGDGRWYLLRSWLNRKIYHHLQGSGRPFRSDEISTLVDEGNQLFAEPMNPQRLRRVALYWTPQAQVKYVARQQRAGTSQRSWDNHRDAVIRYFRALDLRDLLAAQLIHGDGSLPRELQVRDAQFSGMRVTSRSRRITSEYLAWMLGLEDQDIIDSETGEILKTVSAAKQVRYLIANGTRKGYTREQLADYTSELTLDDGSSEEDPAPKLTPAPRYVKLNKYVQAIQLGTQTPPQIVKRKRIFYD